MSSYSTLALTSFHQAPLKHNCAQAVAYGAGRADLLEYLGSCGRGNAEGGICGALYAAKLIAGSDSAAAAIHGDFVLQCESATCKKFKDGTKISCPDCVRIAADLLEAKIS